MMSSVFFFVFFFFYVLKHECINCLSKASQNVNVCVNIVICTVCKANHIPLHISNEYKADT